MLLYFILRQWLGDYGSWYLILLGAVTIGVMICTPLGICGLLSARSGWRIFPLARVLMEPRTNQ